ncbi:hypothetical protein V6N13_047131 [Hibiscus sabdariffa]
MDKKIEVSDPSPLGFNDLFSSPTSQSTVLKSYVSFVHLRSGGLEFSSSKGNGWRQTGVEKGWGSDDWWIDMATPSGDKARSEHWLLWTVVKWFRSEIRCEVSEIKDQSPFV